jgi:hypothetical protein
MKKIYLYGFLFFYFTISNCFAQQIDSAAKRSLDNKRFAVDFVSIYAYEYAKKSPFYLRQFVPKQYSMITFGYRYNQGKLMQAQDAGKVQDAYLSTEGSTMLKSVSLWGMFSYHKIREDSTQYNHQTRNNSSSPYYFGSPINVSYERSIYNVKALAEKDLLHQNLPVGLGADYRIGSHFSTNDPRGSIADFQLNLVGTLGYKLFDRLKIGGAYRYGYGQERFTIAYKNNAYSQNTLIPQYNNYLINGYGEAFVKNTERNYNSNQTRNGFDAYLNYNDQPLGAFNFSYSFVKEKQQYLRSNDAGIFNYNDYKLTYSTFNLLWSKEISQRRIVVNLSYHNIDGADFDYTYLANNYVYNKNEITLVNRLTVKKNNSTYNYQLVISKNGEERKDGLTGNLMNYNNLNLTAGFGLTQQMSKSHFLGFNINGMYSFALNDKFFINDLNVGLFTKTVIFHDYNYNTSAKFGGSASIDYSMPTFGDMQTCIKIGLTYLERGNHKNLLIGQTVGNNRFYSNISLNLYF